MSLSREANGNFERLSTGPLYSRRQLNKVEALLAEEGFSVTEDSSTLGLRIYNKPDGTGSAAIFLSELNCDRLSSGIMMVERKGEKAIMTSVWDYAKQKKQSAAQNSSSRIRQTVSAIKAIWMH